MRKIFPLFSCLWVMALWIACQTPPAPKVVYLVRHAEKDLQDTSSNPPLSPAGEARAQALVTLLADRGIQQVFSTPYQRNLETVQPLADRLGLEVQPYSWHQWQPVIKQIQAVPPGTRLLVCGHGDNLLPMIEAMGATRPLDQLGEHEYDKLFRVSLLPDSSWVKMQSFGE